MKNNRLFFRTTVLITTWFMLVFSGCATQQGYKGAGLGALTGSTAGALIDGSNPWRGAVIGGGLGAAFGGAMTDGPRYPARAPYQPGYYYPNPGYNQPTTSYQQRNNVGRSAAFGGVTGATAGALIDSGNRWRGGIIGGFLGSIFGGGIGSINSQPRVPVLRP